VNSESGGQTRTRSSHRFCRVDDIAEGTTASRTLSELPVAVCRVDGRLSAFHALCPHQQANLSEGIVGRGGITCPDHLWHFDLPSGKCTMVPGAKLELYTVREEDGWIVVDLPS